MRPDLPYIEDKFDYYNRMCFHSQLPTPIIRLNTRYASMGETRLRKYWNKSEKSIVEELSIEISVRRNLPEIEYIDTLLHEMIHYYILVNKWQDDSVHGTLFRKIMNDLTLRYGVKITIDFDEDKEMQINRIDRWRYICVVEFANGEIGLMVVAKNKVSQFWNIVIPQNDVVEVSWYASNREIFHQYPVSVSIGFIKEDPGVLHHYLTGAIQLERVGGIIRAIK